jgi:hypothetical protein
MDCVNRGLEYIELPVMYCLFYQVVGELRSTIRKIPSKITLQTNPLLRSHPEPVNTRSDLAVP